MEQKLVYVGIDVSKDRVDVAVRPSGQSWVVPYEDAEVRDGSGQQRRSICSETTPCTIRRMFPQCDHVDCRSKSFPAPTSPITEFNLCMPWLVSSDRINSHEVPYRSPISA